MAACNVNGLLRQYVGFSLNGSTSNSVGPIREHTAFDEIKHTKPTQTMAPRTVMEHNLVPHVPNGLSVASTVHVSKETPELVDDQHVVRSDVPDGSTRLQKIVPPESGGKMSCLVLQHTDEHSSLESRRFSCKRRLEVCTERLDSLRDRSLALLNRLLAAKLPETFTVGVDDLTQLPESLCRLLDDEETESESDEEPSTQPRPCSSHEENWLCSRAVSCSDWHWLVSEIKRSDRCIKNFRLLRSSLQKWKSGLAIHDPECDIDSSCSRATPFTPRDRRRHSYHNLASPKCARLIGELNKEYNDPCVHCSCVPHHTGPCILCCGASPSNWIPPCDQPQCVDLLHSARPLGAHIHPKLSLPGDSEASSTSESGGRQHMGSNEVNQQPSCVYNDD
ncbi:unnamed protein product [Echinostoma caproni]|uniref:Protein FAM212B n=1 Tax=Echinostoma caproni TaxID=27848 RepID=A0A183AE08_9TREM|nr:unnamed protein product [Echinostoma caproni]